jgi:hypothetical protein
MLFLTLGIRVYMFSRRKEDMNLGVLMKSI